MYWSTSDIFQISYFLNFDIFNISIKCLFMKTTRIIKGIYNLTPRSGEWYMKCIQKILTLCNKSFVYGGCLVTYTQTIRQTVQKSFSLYSWCIRLECDHHDTSRMKIRLKTMSYYSFCHVHHSQGDKVITAMDAL